MKQSGASIKAAILTMSVVQMGTSAIAPIMAASNLGSFLTPVLTVLVKLAAGNELVSSRLACGAALAFIMTALLWLALSGKVKSKAASYL